jgi:putative PIN family toxin of toxin-antitoxin system
VIKVVLDTSVFVAGLLSRSPESGSFQLLEKWRQDAFTVVISPQLLQELIVVLMRRGVLEPRLEELVAVISLIALQIPGAYETTTLDNVDPDDNKFLAAAYEAKADFLVSLDKDLLNLKYFHGTQIITPAAFIQRLPDNN